MNISIFGIGIAILLCLVGIKRIFGKQEIIRRNTLLIDVFLFSGCFLLLGFHFYQRKEHAGLLAVGMGATAVGKYLYDKSRSGKEN